MPPLVGWLTTQQTFSLPSPATKIAQSFLASTRSWAATAPIVGFVTGACEKSLGHSELVVAPWASTAGIFAEAGIPCVVFGPGEVAQAHTVDEFVEIDQVVNASLAYAEIIRSSAAI